MYLSLASSFGSYCRFGKYLRAFVVKLTKIHLLSLPRFPDQTHHWISLHIHRCVRWSEHLVFYLSVFMHAIKTLLELWLRKKREILEGARKSIFRWIKIIDNEYRPHRGKVEDENKETENFIILSGNMKYSCWHFVWNGKKNPTCHPFIMSPLWWQW